MYDIFHAQVMEGELALTLTTHLPRIGHVQFADNPGRHQPGTGEINFSCSGTWMPSVIGLGGAEYAPSGVTEASLGWMQG